MQTSQDGHDSAGETSRPREFTDSRQGEDGAECLPPERGSTFALFPAWSTATFAIPSTGSLLSPGPTGRSKRELQIPGADAEDPRRGG